jgi:acetylornithine deacetylase/succinyl-diaminopimelate desuccinylase-like protein
VLDDVLNWIETEQPASLLRLFVPEIKVQWEGLGFDDREFLGGVGLSVPAGESDRSVFEQVRSRPTFEVSGISGGYGGPGFKAIVPSKATAKVSFRLVGDQDPQAVVRAFQEFVRARVPADCTAQFVSHGASAAVSAHHDGPYLARASRALAEEWSCDPALVSGGGSIPVVGELKRVLGLDSLMVGFGLKDDGIHSPNEKYELSSFHGGIKSWARILAALAN